MSLNGTAARSMLRSALMRIPDLSPGQRDDVVEAVELVPVWAHLDAGEHFTAHAAEHVTRLRDEQDRQAGRIPPAGAPSLPAGSYWMGYLADFLTHHGPMPDREACLDLLRDPLLTRLWSALDHAGRHPVAEKLVERDIAATAPGQPWHPHIPRPPDEVFKPFDPSSSWDATPTTILPEKLGLDVSDAIAANAERVAEIELRVRFHDKGDRR